MAAPARVVSLVPSLTELIWWLGRGDTLVGRTRFCEEPRELVGRVPVVGGTKNPRLERILALEPGLVVANKEENRREDIDALREAGLDVWVTDPNSVAEALEMVREFGERFDAWERASELIAATEHELEGAASGSPVSVFVAIWKEPLMGLGAQSYGNDLLERAGAVNVLRERARYPEVSLDEVAALRPGLVLLPDEPFPFKPADTAMFASVAPAQVIDGKLLWWYGPRMPQALRDLRELLSGAVKTIARGS